jgi:hypothetical protein
VLSMVIEGGSNSGSASLMSIIINIDDFRGCDQIGSNTPDMQIKVLYCSLVHSVQNIDEGSFFTDVVRGNFIAK